MTSPTTALSPLEAVLSEEEQGRLRGEFTGHEEYHGSGSHSAYLPETDRIEGEHVFWDPEKDEVHRSPVVITFDGYVLAELQEAASRVLAQFEATLIQVKPKEVARLTRLYVSEADRLSHGLDHVDPTVKGAAVTVLNDLQEAVQLRARAFRTGSAQTASGGRPLDPEAPQEEIERLVREYADQPRYRHSGGTRDGQPKPTAIRDVLLNEHTEACGPLSERALFDRVKRALEKVEEERG